MTVKSESIVRKPGDRVIRLENTKGEHQGYAKIPEQAGNPLVVFWGARTFATAGASGVSGAVLDRFVEVPTWQLEEVATP